VERVCLRVGGGAITSQGSPGLTKCVRGEYSQGSPAASPGVRLWPLLGWVVNPRNHAGSRPFRTNYHLAIVCSALPPR